MAGKISRPFRIIALPLVRVPHGPLRALGVPAALNAAKAASAGVKSTSDSGPASATTKPGATNGANGDGNGNGDTPLILYHVQQPDVQSKNGPPPIVYKVLDKASDAWLKLGEKKPGSWMRWFYDKGESLMDRVDYEEWSLKNVHEGKGVKIADPAKGEVQEKIEVPLLRPGSVSPPLLPKLHRQLLHRIPYHKKMMTRFLLGSPITWPFAIIPVIPNFPLFYVLWRAWSHYKAWRGAVYLDVLIKNGMVTDKSDAQLDKIYTKPKISAPKSSSTPSSSSKSSTPSTSSESDSDAPEILRSDQEPAAPPSHPAGHYEPLLLTKDDIPALVKAFDLRQSEIIDVERAIDQADHRAAEADKVMRLQAEGQKKADNDK